MFVIKFLKQTQNKRGLFSLCPCQRPCPSPLTPQPPLPLPARQWEGVNKRSLLTLPLRGEGRLSTKGGLPLCRGRQGNGKEQGQQASLVYQLAFLIPTNLPCAASSRNFKRDNLQKLYIDRPRPVKMHRFLTLI